MASENDRFGLVDVRRRWCVIACVHAIPVCVEWRTFWEITMSSHVRIVNALANTKPQRQKYNLYAIKIQYYYSDAVLSAKWTTCLRVQSEKHHLGIAQPDPFIQSSILWVRFGFFAFVSFMRWPIPCSMSIYTGPDISKNQYHILTSRSQQKSLADK